MELAALAMQLVMVEFQLRGLLAEFHKAHLVVVVALQLLVLAQQPVSLVAVVLQLEQQSTQLRVQDHMVAAAAVLQQLLVMQPLALVVTVLF